VLGHLAQDLAVTGLGLLEPAGAMVGGGMIEQRPDGGERSMAWAAGRLEGHRDTWAVEAAIVDSGAARIPCKGCAI
jgi:hypothetical protein